MHLFHQSLAEAIQADRERELEARLRLAPYRKPKKVARRKVLHLPRLRRRARTGVPTVTAG